MPGGRMETLFITQRDMAELIRLVGVHAVMDTMIEALDRALTEHGRAPHALVPRAGFKYDRPNPGVLEWMPFHEPGRAVTIKTVGYHPSNVARGLPTILATVQRFDQATGHLLVAADGVLLTAIRTGAASAVATRVLAIPDASTLGIVGAGAQAVTQAHAISRVCPINEILVHDVDPGAAQSIARRLAFLAVDVRVTTIDELEQRSDVVSTVTTVRPGEGPVLPAAGLHDHVHVNAVGSDLPGKTELPLGFLRRALVCPDFRSQAMQEGECQRLTADEIGPELSEVLAHPGGFAARRRSPTVFDSTGFALEDHVALDVVIQLTDEYGLGTRAALEHIPGDPRNPYELGSLAMAVDPWDDLDDHERVGT